jgi:hypothetical protein
MRHSTITTGLPAFHHHRSICHQHDMCWTVISTRWHMFPTPRAIDPSAVTTGLLALLCLCALLLLHGNCRSLSSTRLSVELTRRRVLHTPQTVHSSGRSSTFVTTVTTSCWVLRCILFPCISCCFVWVLWV